MFRLCLFVACAVAFSACKIQVPSQSGGGAPVVQVGIYTLNMFGDYVFAERTSEVYPPFEKALFKRVEAHEPQTLMSTNGEPYLGFMVLRTDLYEQDAHETMLQGAQVRNLYTETPERADLLSYARYGMYSEKYPVRYQFCEFLVNADDESQFRVIWWSIGAGENMKREAWKVIKTLTYVP